MIVFDKAIWRPVGNIGPKVQIKASCAGAAGNGLLENLAPDSALFIRRFIRIWRHLLEQLGSFRRDRPVPAQMPLADTGGAVAALLGKSSDGHAIFVDQGRTPKADDARL